MVQSGTSYTKISDNHKYISTKFKEKILSCIQVNTIFGLIKAISWKMHESNGENHEPPKNLKTQILMLKPY
jgi:hypothetical protein